MGNIPEEAGKVASETIGALKSSPSCVLGLIFGAAIIVASYFTIRDTRHEWHEREMQLVNKCFPSHEKVYN